MVRLPRVILCSMDNEHSSFRGWSVLTPVLPCFLAMFLAASMMILPRTTATAQEATPGALSESTAMSPVAAASAWLREQQDASGGFFGFSGEPDPGTTTDAVLALYAAQQRDPVAAAALDAALIYLEREETGGAYAETGPGQAAKLALAAVTGGRDPRDFSGMNLIVAMTAPLATPVPEGIGGIYGDDLYDHALVLIALTAAGEAISDAALEPLRAVQGADGGWAFDGSTAPGASDSNSTALVLQALIAAGEDPTSPGWGDAPLALARFQTPSGGLRYMAADEEPNMLATVQAIPAMEGLSLPMVRGCAEGDDTEGCIRLEPAA